MFKKIKKKSKFDFLLGENYNHLLNVKDVYNGLTLRKWHKEYISDYKRSVKNGDIRWCYYALLSVYKVLYKYRDDENVMAILENNIEEQIQLFDIIEDEKKAKENNAFYDYNKYDSKSKCPAEYHYVEGKFIGCGPYKEAIILYEKQKKYKRAFEICNIAIEKNRIDDGTKMGIVGRREKLKKKMRATCLG